MNALWSFLASLTLKLVGPILAYFKGRGDAEKKQAENQLEAIRDVKKIHDTLELDPAERVRIRDKYK